MASTEHEKLLTDLIELVERWTILQGHSGCYMLPIHDMNKLLKEQPSIVDPEKSPTG